MINEKKVCNFIKIDYEWLKTLNLIKYIRL